MTEEKKFDPPVPLHFIGKHVTRTLCTGYEFFNNNYLFKVVPYSYARKILPGKATKKPGYDPDVVRFMTMIDIDGSSLNNNTIIYVYKDINGYHHSMMDHERQQLINEKKAAEQVAGHHKEMSHKKDEQIKKAIDDRHTDERVQKVLKDRIGFYGNYGGKDGGKK